MGAAHHTLGLSYLEIDMLTIRQILRYLEINSLGIEMFDNTPKIESKKEQGLTMAEVGVLAGLGRKHGRR